MISEFTGAYKFLSNFYPSKVHDANGVEYPTVEHAYQASKTHDMLKRHLIRTANSPHEAKKIGRQSPLILGWEYKKFGIMFTLLEEKFDTDPLKKMLLGTRQHKLEEGNTWGDRVWGVCDGTGENHLGKMLMQIRTYLYLSCL